MQTAAQLVAKYSAKAAGVYREIIDATISTETTASQNVVVVGQFTKGPFMRPVQVKSITALHTTFGNRDVKLEAKGNFGVLMAEHMLEQGPVWILNIKNINQYEDTLQAQSVAVNAEETEELKNEPIATVYDTTKFWKVDDAYAKYGVDYNVVTLTSVNNDTLTVLVVKYNDDSYNYTVAETMRQNEAFTGEGLDPDALVSDYLVKAYVFQTDITKAKLSVVGAVSNGVVDMSKIEDIKNDVNAKFFAEYTGAIGDVIDINGNNISIATAINADTAASGLHMSVNVEQLATNGVDLICQHAVQFTGGSAPTIKAGQVRLGQTLTTEDLLVPFQAYVDSANPDVAYVYTANPQAINIGTVIAGDEASVRVVEKSFVGSITANASFDDSFSDSFANGGEVYCYRLKLTAPLTNSMTAEAMKTATGEPAIEGIAYGKDATIKPNGTDDVTVKLISAWRIDSIGSAVAKPYVIAGVVDKEVYYVNGTAARQKAILDKLNDNGIMVSFADKTIFNCRYMVDSFKTYIEPNAKYQYANLADNAKRFLVFTPAPFYHELRTSKNPDFHDSLGQFDMTLVANGYNPDKPSTNSFYFARSSGKEMYLYPVMNVQYNNGFSSKVVPAVGAIGKLFYSKLNGVYKAYDIVAGKAWPVSAAGITGPEFETGPDDRAAMESIGINVLQVIDGVLQIRSSMTAYQSVKSAFNYPETLEKCFYVSDQVESTLDGKLFKYNDADARSAVKLKADSVCDTLVADGAIETYLNICDLSNNPLEVRKAGIIVLDTELYNNYGVRIAVHRTTVKNPEQ